MYCSGCGSEINQGLNFCNSCGTKVTDHNSDLRGAIAKNFSIALGFIGTFGLVGFVFLIRTLLEHRVDDPVLVVLASIYLASFVGLCYFLISNILKGLGSANPVESNQDPPLQMPAPDTARLEAHQEPAQSVVENTTRTLDKVAVERK